MWCCPSKRDKEELVNKNPKTYKKYQSLSNKNIHFKKNKLQGTNCSSKKTILVYSIIMVFSVITTIASKGATAPATIPSSVVSSYYISEESINLNKNNLKIEIMNAVLQDRKNRGKIVLDNLQATLIVKDIKTI
jgi:hypothetical protein